MIFERKGDPTSHLSYKITAYFLEYVELKGKRKVRAPCFPSISVNGVSTAHLSYKITTYFLEYVELKGKRKVRAPLLPFY